MAISKINKFNQKQIENLLKTEYQFINNLFSVMSFPTNTQTEESSDEEEETSKKRQLVTKKTTRATSLVDLQNRIEKLKSKNNVTYKDRIQKKNLKNRLKKKIKQEKRNAVQKQIRANKIEADSKVKSEDDSKEVKTKPVFNKDDKMVFSKIGFNGLGKGKSKKQENNPKKLLEQVQEVKSKVKKLKESGEIEKAVKITEKTAWKNALAKSQGVKVKDDPELLKKSIKKMEQKKRSSKKKWENRIENVMKAKEEKQKKRTENIDKRKKDKKLNKLKKAAKRGKIIPGL